MILCTPECGVTSGAVPLHTSSIVYQSGVSDPWHISHIVFQSHCILVSLCRCNLGTGTQWACIVHTLSQSHYVSLTPSLALSGTQYTLCPSLVV